MKINKNTIKKVLKQLENETIQIGRYGNGDPAKFKRVIIDGAEFTFLIDVQNRLYVGKEGATVSSLKEGRREDNLAINGESVSWASLVAKINPGADIFFTFAKPFEV